ncbi:hypothetical protein ABIA26_004614 [Sinorhizobium fredii]
MASSLTEIHKRGRTSHGHDQKSLPDRRRGHSCDLRHRRFRPRLHVHLPFGRPYTTLSGLERSVLWAFERLVKQERLDGCWIYRGLTVEEPSPIDLAEVDRRYLQVIEAGLFDEYEDLVDCPAAVVHGWAMFVHLPSLAAAVAADAAPGGRHEHAKNHAFANTALAGRRAGLRPRPVRGGRQNPYSDEEARIKRPRRRGWLLAHAAVGAGRIPRRRIRRGHRSSTAQPTSTRGCSTCASSTTSSGTRAVRSPTWSVPRPLPTATTHMLLLISDQPKAPREVAPPGLFHARDSALPISTSNPRFHRRLTHSATNRMFLYSQK